MAKMVELREAHMQGGSEPLEIMVRAGLKRKMRYRLELPAGYHYPPVLNGGKKNIEDYLVQLLDELVIGGNIIKSRDGPA